MRRGEPGPAMVTLFQGSLAGVVGSCLFLSTSLALALTLRRANIVVSPYGVKFNVPQSWDFVTWENVLEMSVENNDLVVRIRRKILPPNIRGVRRITLDTDDPQGILDIATNYMHQRLPPDNTPLQVRPPSD